MDIPQDKIIETIIEELREIPLSRFSTKRKQWGVQREGFARICHALWRLDESLQIEAEFEISYHNGKKWVPGILDAVVYKPSFEGVEIAIEIVADRAQTKDLYKLRDAPVGDGLRLLIRLNPKSEYCTIDRSLALDERISDEDAQQIIILEGFWGGWQTYTLLERRGHSKRKKAEEEAKESSYRIWCKS